MTTPNILIIDIETAPKVAYVWKFWKENVSPDQVVSDGYLMSVSWSWHGDVCEPHCVSCRYNMGNDYGVVSVLAQLLDQCDVVVAHNAKKFDLPTFNARCLIHGIKPPSPYQVVDTLDVARKKFKFDSNSLANLARVLGCKPKSKHAAFPGFTLWKECLLGNQAAWDEMVCYNKDDVHVLSMVYKKMIPWIDNHPNMANLGSETDVPVCPKCGSRHVQKRGHYSTAVSRFQRYVCKSCGGWSRSRYNEKPLAARKKLLANARVF